MVGAWHGHGKASVNQTRLHCANQMGKTHSKTLAARHGRGMAWARHATCESAFRRYTVCIMANWSLAFREVIEIYCKKLHKHVKTLRGQNEQNYNDVTDSMQVYIIQHSC
jgi:hypothetical protein